MICVFRKTAEGSSSSPSSSSTSTPSEIITKQPQKHQHQQYRQQQQQQQIRESDTTLLDGTANSGLVSVACVATSVGAIASVAANGISNADTAPAAAGASSTTAAIPVHGSCSGSITPSESIKAPSSASPTSPNSTTSTAPLISPTLNPLDVALNNTVTINGISEVTELIKMPAKSHSPTPLVVTATTTAEIMDVNRFSLLNNNKEPINSEEFDVYSLPSPPKIFLNGTENGGGSLENGTPMAETFEQISPSNSANQILEEQRRTLYFQKAIAIHKKMQNQQNDYHHHYPINNHSPRIHNNNQGDVNSIESINDDDDTTTISTKIYSSTTLPQHEKQQQQKAERQQQEQQQLKQDQQEQQQNVPEHMILAKSKKKRKKKNGYTKDLDQLDGVAPKQNFNEDNKDDDEKVVKCLYYTLMCCDCTIS